MLELGSFIENEEFEIIYKNNTLINKVYIELTNQCNLACKMCYRNSWSASEGEMNLSTFELILKQLSKLSEVKEIVLGGLGEAMVHSDFWNYLTQLHKEMPMVPITLTTNGLLLTSENIEKLKQVGVRTIVVSVDGADIETQRLVRGKDAGSVSTKLEVLGALFKNNSSIKWNWEFVWQLDNLNQLSELVRMAGECHVDRIIVSHLMPTSPELVKHALYNPTFDKKYEKIVSRARNLALFYKIDLMVPKNYIVTDRNCRFVSNKSLVINYKGQIAPCYRFLHGCKEYLLGRNKDVEAYYFGQISENNTIADIWNQPNFYRFRYRIATNQYPSCPDCEFLEGCDIVNRADSDCDGGVPGCGDCLWARGYIQCP